MLSFCKLKINHHKSLLSKILKAFSSCSESLDQEDHSPGSPGLKSETLFRAKRAGVITQSVQRLPHKCKVLQFKPPYYHKENKLKKRRN
jgi:hypothetical protein